MQLFSKVVMSPLLMGSPDFHAHPVDSMDMIDVSMVKDVKDMAVKMPPGHS